MHQRILSTEWKGNPWSERRYSQIKYLIRNLISRIHKKTPRQHQWKNVNRQRTWTDMFPKKIYKIANKHMKRYSTSLIVREMPSKSQWNITSCPLECYYSKSKNHNTENYWCWWGWRQIGILCVACGNVKWCPCYGKAVWWHLQN